MVKDELLMRPMGAWFIVGGLVTIVTTLIATFFEFKFGSLFAIPAFILLIAAGTMEISTGRSIWRLDIGGRRSIVNTLMITIVVRLILVFALWSNVITSTGIKLPWDHLTTGVWPFFLNIIWLAGEALFLLFIYQRPHLFIEEVNGGFRPDLATSSIKSASECPSCHEVVETYWQSCPYCGTRLPQICGECGGELVDLVKNCPHCGVEIVRSASLQKNVEMFQRMVEGDTVPEMKAVHYSRLAEALLKDGRPDEAIEAYRQAISLTVHPRKRTNFMVRAANILKNTGHEGQALTLLDEALSIDPQDYAGAAKVKVEMGRSNLQRSDVLGTDPG